MQKNIFLCLCLSFSSILFGQTDKLEKAITRYITMEFDFAESPGLAIGVINENYNKTLGFGETEQGNGIMPNENTIFELGSTSKLFTATLIALLEAEGKLSYEDNIATYLDKLYFENKDLKIIDLLTHYSSLPRFPSNLNTENAGDFSPYETYTYPDLLAFLETFEPTPRAERLYLYSHTNYVLLTLLIEKITGQRYEQVLKEKILTPLQMNNTTLTLDEEQKSRLAQGYNGVGKPVEAWNTEVFKGALGLKSTTTDMLKFLQAQLKTSDKPLLKVMHEMQNYTAATNLEKVKVGIGWHHVLPRKNYYTFLAHSGATDGHQIFIAFLKETQTAVVVCSTAKNNNYEVGASVLKLLNNKWKRK